MNNSQNPYGVLGDTAFIGITDENNNIKAVTMIDLEDVAKVLRWKWWLDNGYVKTTISGYTIRLQKLVLDRITANDGLEIDHKDKNKLNNRKENLRICTHRQNMQNIRSNTSGYPGVNWFKRDQCWRARIKDNKGKEIHLGYFNIKENAIAARKAAEEKYNF